MVLDALDEAVEVVSLSSGLVERAVEQALVAGLDLLFEALGWSRVLPTVPAQSIDAAGKA